MSWGHLGQLFSTCITITWRIQILIVGLYPSSFWLSRWRDRWRTGIKAASGKILILLIWGPHFASHSLKSSCLRDNTGVCFVLLFKERKQMVWCYSVRFTFCAARITCTQLSIFLTKGMKEVHGCMCRFWQPWSWLWASLVLLTRGH